ncbi:MAG: hypothetical protein HYY40_10430 [Bacteroidetes bacterium]|nr:hypothetical protein [Bacteroidota bacterium]
MKKESILSAAGSEITLLFLLAFISSLLISCGNGSEQGGEDGDGSEDTTADSESGNQFKVKKTDKVFYTIPSPIEVSALLKRSGATYKKDILNDPARYSKYATTPSMALNLGIYGADLSFTTMFEQTQETMVYLSCVKKLADKLGITSNVNQELLSRVEKSIDNRDSLVQIISDYYWESDAYLKENRQSSTAALVIAGGWVEGIYIATKLVQTTTNREIIGRVGEQKMSLNNLIALLESYRAEDSNVLPWIEELVKLRDSFEGVEIRYTRDEPITDAKTQTTTITTVSTVSINDEQFAKIAANVETIRTKIINL